jgi:hypothetical protein
MPDPRLRERLAALESLPQSSRDALVLFLDALLGAQDSLRGGRRHPEAAGGDGIWPRLEEALTAHRPPLNPTAAEPGHLGPLEIRRLLGYLPMREQVFLFHVTECPICRTAVQQALAPPAGAPTPAPSKGADYSEIWTGLAAGLEETIERVAGERQVAEAVLAELLAIPADQRAGRIRREARFRSLSVAYLLFERSLAASATSTEEAEALAVLGIFLLGQLDSEQAPQLLVHELKARGWALVAYAEYLAGDWAAVREAIEHADEALAEAGYLVECPGIRRLVAKIRLSERQAGELFELVAQAVHLLLRALVGEAPWPLPSEAPASDAGGEATPGEPSPKLLDEKEN